LGFNGTLAQTDYIVPLKSMSESQKREINEKLDNVTCSEYT